VGDLDYFGFGEREWRRIRKAADLGPIQFKDLIDTFASQLLSARVSIQLI